MGERRYRLLRRFQGPRLFLFGNDKQIVLFPWRRLLFLWWWFIIGEREILGLDSFRLICMRWVGLELGT